MDSTNSADSLRIHQGKHGGVTSPQHFHNAVVPRSAARLTRFALLTVV